MWYTLQQFIHPSTVRKTMRVLVKPLNLNIGYIEYHSGLRMWCTHPYNDQFEFLQTPSLPQYASKEDAAESLYELWRYAGKSMQITHDSW